MTIQGLDPRARNVNTSVDVILHKEHFEVILHSRWSPREENLGFKKNGDDREIGMGK